MSEYSPETAGDGRLLFASGITALDNRDLSVAEAMMEEQHAGTLFVAKCAEDQFGVMQLGLNASRGDYGGWVVDHLMTADEVAVYAKEAGVSWVSPTAHCAHTYDLARIAEMLDVNYPSPQLVWALEDKPTFNEELRRAGLLVPESRVCGSAEDITTALAEIGKLAILKTDDGHSSQYLRTVDGGRPLTVEDKRAIAEHIAGRDSRRYNRSILQESVGDREFGMQCLYEVSPDGPRLKWSMTTRKIVLTPFGRMVAHILDPEDEERLEITQDLLIPAIEQGFSSMLEGKPDLLRRRIGRYTLNADFRSDGTNVWWIDGSLRWAPRFQRMANATIGLPAWYSAFPELAERWARGEPVPDEAFVISDEDREAGVVPRAVVMKKAFTAQGGEIVNLPVPEEVKSRSLEAFYVQGSAPGSKLPASYEADEEAAIGVFPQACADGSTIRKAEERWSRAIAWLGLGVVRDGVVYDYRAA